MNLYIRIYRYRFAVWSSVTCLCLTNKGILINIGAGHDRTHLNYDTTSQQIHRNDHETQNI